jgi:hypothetical protein
MQPIPRVFVEHAVRVLWVGANQVALAEGVVAAAANVQEPGGVYRGDARLGGVGKPRIERVAGQLHPPLKGLLELLTGGHGWSISFLVGVESPFLSLIVQ